MCVDPFGSAVRSAGDLAGVLEYDSETAYFYLYRVDGEHGQKVVDSIHFFSGPSDLSNADIAVRWNSTEQKVGLLIRGSLWTVFDAQNGLK